MDLEGEENVENSKNESPEEKKRYKGAISLYREWVKEKEIRNRKKEQKMNTKKEGYAGNTTIQQSTLKKYEFLREKHDTLEKKYKTLSFYNNRFLRDYMMYYEKDRKDELQNSYKSLSNKYIIPIKDLFGPGFNVFSPILAKKKHYRAAKSILIKSPKRSGMHLYRDLVSKLKESKSEKDLRVPAKGATRTDSLPVLLIKSPKLEQRRRTNCSLLPALRLAGS